MERATEQEPSERKRRAIEIADREKELVRRQSDFDCERTIAWRDHGVKVVAGEAELQVRTELRSLRSERTKLLGEVKRCEAELRAQRSKFDRARSNGGGTRSKRGAPKPSVSAAERELRAKLAMLASERAHLDGTAARDRERSAMENAMWNTVLADFTAADW
jgi:hypothetical protein